MSSNSQSNIELNIEKDRIVFADHFNKSLSDYKNIISLKSTIYFGNNFKKSCKPKKDSLYLTVRYN